MIEFRALDSLNYNDYNQLNDILNHYIEYESNKINPIYEKEHLIKLSTWLLNEFKLRDKLDFIISGKFDNSKLEQIFIGCKLKLLYNRNTDPFPYWYHVLYYSRKKLWKPLDHNLLALDSVVTSHFEHQDYTKFYVVCRISKNLLKFQNSQEYLETTFTKTMLSTRYVPVLEQLFYTQDDIDNCKFTGIKLMLPSKIVRPVMLLSYHLKANYLINK